MGYRTGYIGQEGCRGWGRIDEQFDVVGLVRQGYLIILPRPTSPPAFLTHHYVLRPTPSYLT